MASSKNPMKKKIFEKYNEMERRFHPSGVDYATYDTPVNFKESLECPLHRWYAYKEGFSPSFVRSFIQKYSTKEKEIVFDPFGGVGTTALVAEELGHCAYAMDVSPLGVFIASAKTHKYSRSDVNTIKKVIGLLKPMKNYKKDVVVPNQTVRRYFDESTWDALLRFLSFSNTISDKSVKNLFLLAIVSLIADLSTHKKNGNGVKKKKMAPPPQSFRSLKKLVISRLELFCEDILATNLRGECTIWKSSNLIDYELPQKASLVLTSPPYANCFDYSKVYLTELWVGGFFKTEKDQKEFRENSVSSHVHYSWSERNAAFGSDIVNELIVPYLKNESLWSEKIPQMLVGYFSDMGRFLYNLKKNLEDKAVVGIVVGNSVYGGLPVATDIIIADMAEKLGYKCVDVKVYRKVVASSQQMVLLSDSEKKFVRESMVVLQYNEGCDDCV